MQAAQPGKLNFLRFCWPGARILQTWGIHPGKLLMVGDSHEDVECGNAAGTATCLIAGGGNEVGECIVSVVPPMQIVGEALACVCAV